MKLFTLYCSLLVSTVAGAAQGKPTYVTNYIYVTNYVIYSTTNYVYGSVTNHVFTTNVLNITNTVNNYAYTTTTNWINATNYVSLVPTNGMWITNLNVSGQLYVDGTNGTVTTYKGNTMTGHLP